MEAASHTAMGSLATVLESRLAELVPPDADPMMLRIRDAVARGMDAGQLEIANVAQRLAMSTRSLQRALAQRGVKHLVLTGRRGLDTPGAESAVAELRAHGAAVAAPQRARAREGSPRRGRAPVSVG